ncbi:MAG: flavoprotein, partial [Akkermansia sp.]
LVIAPATANTLAEFAHGLAPDILSSLYLANRAPVLICPAMNTMMWTHEATQNNIKTLASRKNHYILDPASDGILACGVEGQGKLAPVDDIITRIQELCPAQR